MERTYDPTGKALLRISGIVMIIFGIFGILLYAAALGLLLGVTYITDGIFSGTRDVIGISLLLAGALAELICGIVSVKGAKRPARARRCLVWGILTLIITLAGLIHILLRDAHPMYWLIIPMAIVTPIVCLTGAAKLRRPIEMPEE